MLKWHMLNIIFLQINKPLDLHSHCKLACQKLPNATSNSETCTLDAVLWGRNEKEN